MRLINKKRLSTFVLVISIVLFPAAHVQAFNYNTSASSASVLRFQQKMASKGHANSQYKLAIMHESGIGVEKNIDTAKSGTVKLPIKIINLPVTVLLF